MKKIHVKIISILAIITVMILLGAYIAPTIENVNMRDFIEGFVVGITSVMIVVWIVVYFVNLRQKSKEKDPIVLRNIKHKNFLIFGMIFLAASILIIRLTPESDLNAIISVVLSITSLVFMLRYVVLFRKYKICKQDNSSI